MSLRREPWGTTRAGERVELFTLECAAARARVATFGATLVGLELPSRERGRGGADVVLGFDSLAGYESAPEVYAGGVIGRFANRIARARFALDGREHALSANEGPHHLHGGRRGFDRRVWTAVDASDGALELAYTSADGEEGYPGAVHAHASYALSHEALVVRLWATSSGPTPVNMTQHAYFNLAGEGTILEHELEIRASRYVAVDRELIPTGALLDVGGTPYDFRAPRRAGARVAELRALPAGGYDVCYALDGGSGFAARLRDPASGRALEVHTNQPGLQLYTGQHLGSHRGKGGRALVPFAGLCLETQGFPDAVNQPAFPSPILRPGERYESLTTWRWNAQA